MSTMLRTAGYVKLAKLWEKNRDEAIILHRTYFEERCTAEDGLLLQHVYVDITGSKHVYRRNQMVKLLRDCKNQKIDVILTPSRAYLAPNTEEFCYLILFIWNLSSRIDIISDDDDFRIDTIMNVENQRESLYQMAAHFSNLNPDAYEEWNKRLVKAMNQCEEGEPGEQGNPEV